MHPVLARYLDPHLTRDLLRRVDAGEDLGPAHRHLTEVAREWEDERREILAAPQRLPPPAQSALLFLATHAALRAAREDPGLAGAFAEAEQALRAHGAKLGEPEALFAQLIAEEAFGTEDDPDSFDAEWIREGLRDLPHLLALVEEQVQGLLDDFAALATTSLAKRCRARAARLLLESAWSQGIAPINVDHVGEALNGLRQELGEAEFPAAALALEAFIAFLHQRSLMGKLRAGRLGKMAGLAAILTPE